MLTVRFYIVCNRPGIWVWDRAGSQYCSITQDIFDGRSVHKSQIPNMKGLKKQKNTSIFGNTKMKWKKQIKTVHYFHSLDTWRTKDKHSEVIFTIYNYTHIEYLFLKVMNCISCIMSNINAPLAVTALCTALPWTIFYCLDVSPFSVNCHLTLTIKCKKQSQQSPRNRRDRQYSQVWSNH